MNLHEHKEAFADLISITAQYIGIPETAVKRDYYIVKILQRLANSGYADLCVFKGGTSLSKCYPGSINRFSEDIDLTFIPREEFTKKQYDKSLKKIEAFMAEGSEMEKIPEERNDRNKSAYIWFDGDRDTRIKLEMGSSVRPDPYEKKSLKTYIQEYLESQGMFDVIKEFELEEVSINTLAIERTFLDKVMAVKRHAICGTLSNKVRHIYDVTMLYRRDDIQSFLSNKIILKELIQKTKQTDRFYLEKRRSLTEYNPATAYDFSTWEKYFDKNIEERYGRLHEDLLYTSEKQNFSDAIKTFETVSRIFAEINE